MPTVEFNISDENTTTLHCWLGWTKKDKFSTPLHYCECSSRFRWTHIECMEPYRVGKLRDSYMTVELQLSAYVLAYTFTEKNVRYEMNTRSRQPLIDKFMLAIPRCFGDGWSSWIEISPSGWTLKLLHDDHDVLIPSKWLRAQSQWKRKPKMSDKSWDARSIPQRIDRTNEFAVCFYFANGWVSQDFQWIYIYRPPSQLTDNELALIPYFPIQCYPNEERKNFQCKKKWGLAERNIAIRLL